MNKKLTTVDDDFITGTARDRVIEFNLFNDLTALAQGEMLELMFQAKDYQDLGYNDFKKFVDAELNISPRTAKRHRELFISAKLAPETESKLKEKKVISRKELHGGVAYKSVEAEALADEVVVLAETESVEVVAQLKNKSVGMKAKKQVLESNLSKEDKVTALKSKDGFKKIMDVKDDKIKKSDKLHLNKSAIEKNDRLVNEIKKLRTENKELLQALDTAKAIERLSYFLRAYHDIVFAIRKMKSKNARLFQTLTIPVRNALEVLGAVQENFEGLDTIKRLYKEKAKTTHPDAGGTAEQFDELRTAYELLKKQLA